MSRLKGFLTTKQSRPSFFVTLFLLLVFIFSLTRLLSYISLFGNKSLQLDFSAYYTAGESLNHGLSPYENNVIHDPPVWDGVARYEYSRFLYPPLVASFFQPFAKIPYYYAKFAWSFVSLVCIFVALKKTEKLFPVQMPALYLLVGIFTLIYFPLLAHLERGQIDALTLLLITMALHYLIDGDGGKEVQSGILLALATMFKLYAVFFIPFVLVKKRWKVLLGYVYGGLIIVLATIAFQSSPGHLVDYLFDHVPRMANSNNIVRSAPIDEKLIRAVLDQVPGEFDTTKDGRFYKLYSLKFVTNATLVEPVQEFLDTRGVRLSIATISVCLFGLFFSGVLAWEVMSNLKHLTKPQEYIYWQIPLVIILLVGPLTWTMNTVWLLPLIIIAISLLMHSSTRKQKIALVMIFLGLLIAALPDAFDVTLFNGGLNVIYAQKYIIAELTVLMGMMIYLRYTAKLEGVASTIG